MTNDPTPPKPQNTSTGSFSKPPVSSNPLDASDTRHRDGARAAVDTAVADLLNGDDTGQLLDWVEAALDGYAPARTDLPFRTAQQHVRRRLDELKREAYDGALTELYDSLRSPRQVSPPLADLAELTQRNAELTQRNAELTQRNAELKQFVEKKNRAIDHLLLDLDGYRSARNTAVEACRAAQAKLSVNAETRGFTLKPGTLEEQIDAVFNAGDAISEGNRKLAAEADQERDARPSVLRDASVRFFRKLSSHLRAAGLPAEGKVEDSIDALFCELHTLRYGVDYARRRAEQVVARLQ